MSEKNTTPADNETQNSNDEQQQDQRKNNSSRLGKFLIGLMVPVLILVIALAVWMYVPAVEEFVLGTHTPTALPPSPTVTFTATATNTALPTSTAVPTQTPMPLSAYTTDPAAVDPKIPGLALDAVVLNEDTSVTIDPPFDDIQWYSSEKISEQIGYDIAEPFFATTGPGTAVWKMDVPLQVGLYDIYILDTVYSSAGGLDFGVMLGTQELIPLLGSLHVEYSSQTIAPVQLADKWAYLGTFDLTNSTDLLSIMTTWEARDLSTIVAIDRVLIVRQPDAIRPFIVPLPENLPKYIIDDSSAVLDSSANWSERDDLLAYNGDSQTMRNPDYDSTITWTVPCQVPVGEYNVIVWVPDVEGNADLVYRILVNGMQSQGTLMVNSQDLPKGQWISLGSWHVTSDDSDFVKYVNLGLSLTIPRGSEGEFGFDSAAFIFEKAIDSEE